MPRSTKSGSKTERETLRHEMLASGCPPEMVAVEMQLRWGFRAREAHRHARGWSQDEVAARFSEIIEGRAERAGSAGPAPGRGPNPTAPMIGTRIGEYERWPNGGRRPSAYVLAVLAAVFSTSVERLLDYDDYRQLPDRERTVVSTLLAARPGRSLADRAAGEKPDSSAALPVGIPDSTLDLHGRLPAGATEPDPEVPVALVPLAARVPALPVRQPGALARQRRRDALLDAPAGTVVSRDEVVGEAADQAAEFGEWAEATNVGATTLEQLESDVWRISHAYLRSAPVPLLFGMMRVRNRAFSLIEGRQHPNQTRQLHVLSGRICGLIAWMCSDLGRHAEAETHARTGWLCADLAGSSTLRGWIRATQAKLAYWDGRLRESARLAEDGLRHPAADTVRPLLAALAARSWARLGDIDRARAALRRAQDERSAVRKADEVGGLYGFSEAQQSYLEGTTHLWMREPTDALRAADRAVWLYEVGPPDERFYAAESLALVDAAIAHLQADELDGAASRLTPVLALPPAKRLEVIDQRLGDLRRMLRRSRYAMSRPGVELQRGIAGFSASPANGNQVLT